MPRYEIIVPITRATGHRVYEVEASSPEEALALYHQGDVDFVDEVIDVEDVGDPEVHQCKE